MAPLRESGKRFADFLESAASNVRESQKVFPEPYAYLDEIHDAYSQLIDEGLQHLREEIDQGVGLFVLRAHTAYLGACRLALSGQAVESYMVNRGCLEAALYGVFLHRNPHHMRIWLDRHKDDVAKKACKDVFKVTAMIDLLEGHPDPNTGERSGGIDQKTGERIRELYERTVDFGAHPNERGVLQTMYKVVRDGSIDHRNAYLTSHPTVILASMKTTAQAGLLALDAFANVYATRMALIGLGERIRELRSSL